MSRLATILITVALVLTGCTGAATDDVAPEEPGSSAPAGVAREEPGSRTPERVEGGNCNVMTGEPGPGEGVYVDTQGGGELECVSQEGEAVGGPGFSEPVNEQWVDDPLLNAQINDMADMQGLEYAQAYAEYYECNAELGPVPVDQKWAVDIINEGVGNKKHSYNDAVDASNEQVDAYNARLDGAEDCAREFARVTGEVPYDIWRDDESEFGTIPVGDGEEKSD